jgi:hypothetical protein
MDFTFTANQMFIPAFSDWAVIHAYLHFFYTMTVKALR